jgi:hypothetical protein
MRLVQWAAVDRGQATVETLALLPFVVAAAVGLCAAGLWYRQTVTVNAAVASGAVALLEAPDPTDIAAARRNLGTPGNLSLKKGTTAVELTVNQRGWDLAGVSAERSAKLRWVGADQ